MSQESQIPTSNRLEQPFLVELWEENKQPGGYFTPAATMHLTSSLRTSGLLTHLSPDDTKSLIFLLTFLSPEGHCQPFLTQLAEAMHVVPAKAKARMKRLCDVRWKGEPIVIYSKSASGLTAYSLNPRIVSYQHRKKAEASQHAPYVAARREDVIAHSRKHYARPREEVERMIARQMGQDVNETDAERKIRFRLENAGLTGEQAKELLANYELDVIAQQLDWLPFRNAKNPAGYLMAAIEGKYGEPRAVREERLFRELRYGEMQTESREQTESLEADGNPQDTVGEDATVGKSNATPADAAELAGTQSLDLPLPDADAGGQ